MVTGSEMRAGQIKAEACIERVHKCVYYLIVTAAELKRWLEKQGCTFKTSKSGHLKVRCGERNSVLPMHGKNKELGKGLVEAIKKQLGLK